VISDGHYSEEKGEVLLTTYLLLQRKYVPN
jgi:hypothetical protein